MGTFYNHESHADGCLQCVCSNITTECGSTFLHLRTVDVDIQNETVPSLSTLGIGNELAAQDVTIPMVMVGSLVMAQGDLGQGATSNVYWLLPGDTLRGNLLGLYDGKVSFSIYYTSTQQTADPTTPFVTVVSKTGARVRFAVPPVSLATFTDVEVVIGLSSVDQSAGNVSRADILYVLSNVERLLIPAAFYQFDHTS